MMNVIQIFIKMILPTPNRITDRFGAFRDWSEVTGWSPDKSYAPIHAGTDFSAIGSPDITAPGNGKIWGEFVHSVGSCICFIPYESKDLMLYFIHCEPTQSKWTSIKKSHKMTTQASHGTAVHHLHFEAAVTEKGFEDLCNADAINSTEISDNFWRSKARMNNLNYESVMQRIQHQKDSWGIRKIFSEALLRSYLPDYKKSRLSNVGEGNTYIIDAVSIIGRLA